MIRLSQIPSEPEFLAGARAAGITPVPYTYTELPPSTHCPVHGVPLVREQVDVTAVFRPERSELVDGRLVCPSCVTAAESVEPSFGALWDQVNDGLRSRAAAGMPPDVEQAIQEAETKLTAQMPPGLHARFDRTPIRPTLAEPVRLRDILYPHPAVRQASPEDLKDLAVKLLAHIADCERRETDATLLEAERVLTHRRTVDRSDG